MEELLGIKDKRILVTGSAGKLGSALVNYLVEKSSFIYGCDNLSTGKMERVSEKANKNFWHVDLRQRKTVEFLMRIIRPNVIFHCAGWHQPKPEEDAYSAIDNNIGIFVNVLCSFIKSKGDRFILVIQSPKKEGLYSLVEEFMKEFLRLMARHNNVNFGIVEIMHEEITDMDLSVIVETIYKEESIK